jgi:hypothetical protein
MEVSSKLSEARHEIAALHTKIAALESTATTASSLVFGLMDLLLILQVRGDVADMSGEAERREPVSTPACGGSGYESF